MTANASLAVVRGCAVGTFTATLAVAAHSYAGGVPVGGAIALLTVLACATGIFAATAIRTDSAAALLAVLTVGQLLGHVALATGHSHGVGAAAPLAPMLLAHAAAVGIGTLLIVTGERLCAALSSVLRGAERLPQVATSYAPSAPIRSDHRMRREQLIATSISHRGPPLGV